MGFKFLEKLDFFTKTKLLVFIILFSMLWVVAFSLYSVFTFKNDIDTLFQKRTVPVVKIENIKDIYKQDIYDTLNIYINKTPLVQTKSKIKNSLKKLEKEWREYFKSFLPNDENEKKVLNEVKKLKELINSQVRGFLQGSGIDLELLKSRINKLNVLLSDIVNRNITKAVEQKSFTDKRFEFVIKASVISIVVVFFFSITLVLMIVDNFKKIHVDLEEKVKEKTKELERINKNLEKRIQKAVEDNRRKDRIMFQQSKLAAMGEMLQNIAHQWRQPLGSISLILQSFKIKNEMNRLSCGYIDRKTEEALVLADNMSKTIDDFKNFFRPDKTKKVFNLKESLYHSKQLVSHLLEKYAIDLEIKIKEDIYIYGYKNEFLHVCLNIINNAVDSLKEKELPVKKILIVVKKEKKCIIISIIDNGGGINPEYIDKIFEPYFTTKLKDKGSGIGLYMSKQIIEEHMNGKIKVLNIKHKLGSNTMYKCAMFEITIPLKDTDGKI